MKSYPKRGEVYWVNLDPTIGSEIKKTRPGLIISNNIANQFSSRVIILPITSKTKKIYPFEVALTLAEKNGKVMVDQIRAVDKKRLGKKIAMCDLSTLDEINKNLKFTLELD